MEVDLVNIISTVGFPIVVALWFMLRVEKILKDHSEVCRSHAELVRQLISTLDNKRR